MPHPVAAAASAAAGSITDHVSARPSQIEHTTADGTNSAATSRAGRTWRWTASEESASRPATVPNVENAPSRTRTGAARIGHLRGVHIEGLFVAPNSVSMSTRPELNLFAVSSTETFR